MRRWIAGKLRTYADRIDPDGAPRYMGPYSFTIEHLRGVVFREDGKGCPLAYFGEDYRRAHAEADTDHAIVDWANGTARFGR